MIENREEQKEALEALLTFNGRLVGNMRTIAKELKNGRLDDTEAFLNDVIQAINWEIQVFNGTMELLNEGKARVDKEAFNEKVKALGDAIAAKEDAKMADAFEAAIPVFEAFGAAAAEVTA